MSKLLATCDRILAKLPLSASESNVIDGIIIPQRTLDQMKGKNLIELEVLSAGPDCKVARNGDKVLVNPVVCSPMEWDGQQYMVFSEVTAFAIVRTEPAVEPPEQP